MSAVVVYIQGPAGPPGEVEGGTVADGAITTAKLAANAVTAAKVDGTIATQAELDAEAATRAAADTTNATAITTEASMRAAAVSALDARVTTLEGRADTRLRYGSGAPSSGLGANGDGYLDYAAGVFYEKSGGSWTARYTDQTGEGGGSADGTLLYGTGAPGSGLGSNGDAYINTDSGAFYKKTLGSWSLSYTDMTGSGPGFGVPKIYPESYGAVGDVIQINDGVMEEGSDILESASNPFVEGHEGKLIAAPRTGADGGVGHGTIVNYINPGTVQVSFEAEADVEDSYVTWGTSDVAAFNLLEEDINELKGVDLILSSVYGFGGLWHHYKNNTNVIGCGLSYAELQSPDNQPAWGTTLIALVPGITLMRVRATVTNRLTNVILFGFAMRGLDHNDGCLLFDNSKADGSVFASNALWIERVSAARSSHAIKILSADAFKMTRCAVNLNTDAVEVRNSVFTTMDDCFIGDNHGEGVRLINEYQPTVGPLMKFIRNGGGGLNLYGCADFDVLSSFQTDETNQAEYDVPHGLKVTNALQSGNFTTAISRGRTISAKFSSLGTSGPGTWSDCQMIIEGGSSDINLAGTAFGPGPGSLRLDSANRVLVNGVTFHPDAANHITQIGGSGNVITEGGNIIDDEKVVTTGAGMTILDAPFSGTNGTTDNAYTPDTGTYTIIEGQAEIQDNAMEVTSFPWGIVTDTGTPIHRVTVTFNLAGGTVDFEVFLRYIDADNYLMRYFEVVSPGEGVYALQTRLYHKTGGGSLTALTSHVTVATLGANSDNVDRTVVCYVDAADNVCVEYDGDLVTFTNTDVHAAGELAGVGVLSANGVTVKDLLIEDISAL